MRAQILTGMQVEHDLGKIVIRNMDETDIDGGAVLLSRSFAGRQWQSLEEVRCVFSGLHFAAVMEQMPTLPGEIVW